MKLWKKVTAVFLFLAFLIVLQVRNPEITGPFRGILGNILNPFVYYTSKTTGFFSDAWTGYINLVNTHDENIKLKVANGELRLENQLLEEKVAEYQRLKKLLNFKEFNKLDTIACNIVGRNVEGYLKYYIIDRGLSDGIKVKDPVISFNGLVGMVTETTLSTSKVQVILNLSSNVSVINSRTRTVGILRGDGRGKLAVDYYDRLDSVRKGDEFITSGLGGVYPKGIVAGRVDSISSGPTGLFQKLSVMPTVDFYKLENILVVKKNAE